MVAAPQTPSARFRAALLEHIPAHAAAMGWTEPALKAAAGQAGLSEGEALLACPNGVADLMDSFAAQADAAMLERLSEIDLPAMRVRDRVKAAVLARLEVQAPHKDACRAMHRALTRPTRAPLAAKLVWRTADAIWRELGDTSTDENFYSKRVLLAGVLGASYARWFSDDSPEMEATEAFVEARIENIMGIEKAKARFKPLSEAAETAIAIAARLRYGGR